MSVHPQTLLHSSQISGRGSACRMCGTHATTPAGNVDGYDLAACQVCAYAFVPSVTQEGLRRLYEAGFHGATDGAPETGWAKDRAPFLDIALERLEGQTVHALEFGCGQSRTADLLRARGHRVTAVDIVPPTRPHPDRLTGDLLGFGFDTGGFDLAYAYQVFEHLPEPGSYLDELLRVTRRGGYVLIHTDMETAERGDDLTSWWYVKPPDHCSFYRHHTFEHYLEGTPHRIVHRDAKRIVIRRG